MEKSNIECSDRLTFVQEVMKKIKIISELDHSPGYETSLKYYKMNGTLNGIENYLRTKQK